MAFASLCRCFFLLGGVTYLLVMIFIPMRHNRSSTAKKIFWFHYNADRESRRERCLWAQILALATGYQVSAVSKKPISINLFVPRSAPHIKTLLSHVQQAFDIEFSYVPSDDAGAILENRDVIRLSQDVSLQLVRLDSPRLPVYPFAILRNGIKQVHNVVIGFEAALKTTGNRLDLIVDTCGAVTAVTCFSWLTCQFRREVHTYVHSKWHTRGDNDGLGWMLYDRWVETPLRFSGWAYKDPVVTSSADVAKYMGTLWPLRKTVVVLPPIPPTKSVPGAQDKRDLVVFSERFGTERVFTDAMEGLKDLLDQLQTSTRFLFFKFSRGGRMPRFESDLRQFVKVAERILSPKVSVEVHAAGEKLDPTQPITKQSVEFHVGFSRELIEDCHFSAKVGVVLAQDEVAVVEMLTAGMFVVARDFGYLHHLLADSGGRLCLIEGGEQFAEKLRNGIMQGLEEKYDQEKVRSIKDAMQRKFPNYLGHGKQVLRAWNLDQILGVATD